MIDCSIDEFITTLQSIFENRIHICTDCSICNLYNISNKSIDIKNLSIKTNVEDGNKLIVTGKELKFLLHQRLPCRAVSSRGRWQVFPDGRLYKDVLPDAVQ